MMENYLKSKKNVKQHLAINIPIFTPDFRFNFSKVIIEKVQSFTLLKTKILFMISEAHFLPAFQKNVVW